MPTSWILNDNLQLFLTLTARFIGYSIDDSDRDAVHFGIEGTDSTADRWYEYPLIGKSMVYLGFTYSDRDSQLAVRWDALVGIGARIDSLALILQCYSPYPDTAALEELITAAFPNAPYPLGVSILGCTGAHLAICTECQEARELFEGRVWMDLVRAADSRPPLYYSGPVLLRPEARIYFFPAYLVAALRDNDSEWLEGAHSDAAKREFTGLQFELIEFVEYVIGLNL